MDRKFNLLLPPRGYRKRYVAWFLASTASWHVRNVPRYRRPPAPQRATNLPSCIYTPRGRARFIVGQRYSTCNVCPRHAAIFAAASSIVLCAVDLSTPRIRPIDFRVSPSSHSRMTRSSWSVSSHRQRSNSSNVRDVAFAKCQTFIASLLACRSFISRRT